MRARLLQARVRWLRGQCSRAARATPHGALRLLPCGTRGRGWASARPRRPFWRGRHGAPRSPRGSLVHVHCLHIHAACVQYRAWAWAITRTIKQTQAAPPQNQVRPTAWPINQPRGMRGALAMNMQRSQMRRHTQPRGGFGAALLGVKVNSALASLAQCRPSARLATWMARTNRAACWPNASGAGSARCCHCRQHGPPPPRWTTP